VDDQSLLRYSRHLLLDAIGIEGQERLAQARVVVVGAGGLGSPAAMYLAASGAGTLLLVDHDTVALTNLQRQIAHTTGRLGQPKAESAAHTLRALNPTVRVEARVERADVGNLEALVQGATVVLDCSDNRATRQALNAACLAATRPLVSGSASGFAGQLAVFDFREAGTPCYACLFPPGPGTDDDCATMGVFAPLTGVVGTLQAAEAIKLICGISRDTRGALWMIDLHAAPELQALHFARDPHCPVCGPRG
jgi:molybdopterin-synthase adenylyltransferase